MIADAEGRPFLVLAKELRPWQPGGYGSPVRKPVGDARVLTPPSIVRAVAHGYPVERHPSAG
jgi:hypothetical protein